MKHVLSAVSERSDIGFLVLLSAYVHKKDIWFHLHLAIADSMRPVCCARGLQSQVVSSVFDQLLHGAHVDGLKLPSSATSSDILAAVQCKYGSLPPVRGTAWEAGFTHLVNYGAGYYSYL